MDYSYFNCRNVTVTEVIKHKVKSIKKNSFKNALIVLNGKLSYSLINKFTDLNKPRRQHVIIAADGASDFLFRHRIIPDVIIGDLDSISSAAKKNFTLKKVKIIKITDQYRNDLEKCLDFALSNGIKKISIVGFSGKRFDHTINNISILKKFSGKADLTVFERNFEYFFINKKIEFVCKPGDIVSLIALPLAAGITTKGLKYPLKNEILELGKREGALNTAISEKVKIRFTKGDLLVVKNIKL